VPRQQAIPVQTVIYDVDPHEPIVPLEGAMPLKAGDVLELGSPNRDARVLVATFQVDKSEATLLVEVEIGEPGKWGSRPAL
jgi:hypothetical protein